MLSNSTLLVVHHKGYNGGLGLDGGLSEGDGLDVVRAELTVKGDVGLVELVEGSGTHSEALARSPVSEYDAVGMMEELVNELSEVHAIRL